MTRIGALERQTGCLSRQINEVEDRSGSTGRAGTAENGPSPVHGVVFGGADAVRNLFGALERQVSIGSLLIALTPLCGVAAALTTSCQQKQKSPLEKGAGTFSRACASCHAVPAGKQTRLGFKTPPPNLADAKLQERLSDEQIRMVIRQGKGQMPPFGKMLPDSEVSDLLVYLRSLPRNKPAAQ
jgi:mono/diheme cytochrome c family protein